MASHDVKFVVQFDDTGAIKKIQDFDKAIEDLGKTTETKAAPAIQGLWKDVAAGGLVIEGIKKSWSALKGFISDSVNEAIESEQAQHRLRTALEMTGRASEYTYRNMLAFAQAEQQVTLFTDEQITSAMTLFTQWTKLDRDGIQKLTRGAMGLATVMGTDLESAAQKVVNAMRGNIEGLRGTTIEIDATLPKHEQLKQLVEKLADLYPRATAEINTFGGTLSQLGKAWGEFKEAMGRTITESTPVTTFLQDTTKYLNNLNYETKESASLWRIIAEALGGGNVSGIMAATAARTKEAANYTRDLDKEIRGLAADFVGYIREIQSVPSRNLLVAKSFKAIAGAVLDVAYAEDMMEPDISAMFPADEVIALPPFLQDIVDASLNVQTATSGMSTTWNDAMLSMTSGLVSFGDANATIWENVGNVFGNFVKSAISGIEAMVIKEIWAARVTTKAKQNEATASHISNIFKSVPFPLDLILAAGAFAVVNALFAKLFKFEKGGYFSKPTYLPGALVGEAGPEFILPEKKLEAAIDRAIGGKRRSDTLAGPVTYSFNITGPVLATSAALTDEMISSAASKLFREMENQARLRGRRLM